MRKLPDSQVMTLMFILVNHPPAPQDMDRFPTVRMFLEENIIRQCDDGTLELCYGAPEMEYQYVNDKGNFLIEVDGKRSHSVSYRGVATLKIDDKLYVGVSAYYVGSLPTETVFEVQEIPGCENISENFTEPEEEVKKTPRHLPSLLGK